MLHPKHQAKGLLRTSGGLNTTNITVNNSVLEHIGWNGYGLINISGTNTIERIEVTNSTLINMGEQLMDIDGGIGDVVFTNNTLYMPAKMEKPMNQLFRFDNYNKTPASPARVTMSGCIFAGLNGDKSLNAGSKKYSFFDYSDNLLPHPPMCLWAAYASKESRAGTHIGRLVC